MSCAIHSKVLFAIKYHPTSIACKYGPTESPRRPSGVARELDPAPAVESQGEPVIDVPGRFESDLDHRDAVDRRDADVVGPYSIDSDSSSVSPSAERIRFPPTEIASRAQKTRFSAKDPRKSDSSSGSPPMCDK